MPRSVIDPPPFNKTVNLSGPRFGMTALSPGVVAELERRSINVGSNITQFGWQFEKAFYAKGSGLAAVNEWVMLLGGLEQGHVLPSLSWLVGMRTREGAEFGVGPNVTPAGVALVVAAGVTVRTRFLQRTAERGRGAVEGRHARERAERVQYEETVGSRLQAPGSRRYGTSVSVCSVGPGRNGVGSPLDPRIVRVRSRTATADGRSGRWACA